MPSFKATGFLAENGRPNFKALANKGIQVLGDFHTHYSLKIIIGDWQAVRPLLSGLTENKDYTLELEAEIQLFLSLIPEKSMLELSQEQLFVTK